MTDSRTSSWTVGDHLTHRFNPELGIGRVTAIDGRSIVADFPRSGTTLRLAASTDALVPVDLSPGRPVRVSATREETRVAARLPDGRLRLANGSTEPAHALWPLELERALLERLALGDTDDAGDSADPARRPAPAAHPRGRRPRLVPRRPGAAVPAPAPRRRAGHARATRCAGCSRTKWASARPSRRA